jgi:hypothetical protein
MSTASQSWGRKPLQPGQRSYSGRVITPEAAGEWTRLSGLIAKAKHPAARAFLVHQRSKLTKG